MCTRQRGTSSRKRASKGSMKFAIGRFGCRKVVDAVPLVSSHGLANVALWPGAPDRQMLHPSEFRGNASNADQIHLQDFLSL